MNKLCGVQMDEGQRKEFYSHIASVYAFYRADSSPFALGVWWEAMRPFDFAAVKGALNRHAVNPDNGQFLPKPADVVKLMGGGTQDAALVAWSKVDRAVRGAGPYQSVVFDDPLVHMVIQDMGGWIQLCSHDEDEWPFRAKEFENRYRGYRVRWQADAHPTHLMGIAEAHNLEKSQAVKPPLMIGDARRCAVVFSGGDNAPRIGLQPLRLPDLEAMAQ